MAKRKIISIIVISCTIAILLSCGLLIVSLGKGLSLANEIPFSDPPRPFDDSVIVGTWFTKYAGWGEDTLIVLPNGKFKQIYKDHSVDTDVFDFESSLNNWWIEPLPDGRIYLHLEGAKYFSEGIAFADRLNGYKVSCSDEELSFCEEEEIRLSFKIYDWIGKEYINMSNELILNIRLDSFGEIILVHMRSSSDGGFPIIGGDSKIFRRNE